MPTVSGRRVHDHDSHVAVATVVGIVVVGRVQANGVAGAPPAAIVDRDVRGADRVAGDVTVERRQRHERIGVGRLVPPVGRVVDVRSGTRLTGAAGHVAGERRADGLPGRHVLRGDGDALVVDVATDPDDRPAHVAPPIPVGVAVAVCPGSPALRRLSSPRTEFALRRGPESVDLSHAGCRGTVRSSSREGWTREVMWHGSAG